MEEEIKLQELNEQKCKDDFIEFKDMLREIGVAVPNYSWYKREWVISNGLLDV